MSELNSVDLARRFPEHRQLLLSLKKGLAHPGGGEVLVRSNRNRGCVLVSPRGGVAWCTASSFHSTFAAHLQGQGIMLAEDFRKVVSDCQKSGHDLFQTLVEWKLVDQVTIVDTVIGYFASNVLEFFAWPQLDTTFLPAQNGARCSWSFPVEDVMQRATELGRLGSRAQPYIAELSGSVGGFPLGASPPRESPKAPQLLQLSPAPQSASNVYCYATNTTAERPSKPVAPGARTDAMNIVKLKEMFKEFTDSTTEGLVASDIFSRTDGQSVMGFNSNPAACALFCQVSRYLDESLRSSGFPPINQYMVFDLQDNRSIVLVYLNEIYIWGILADTSKLQLGLLLNVIVPTGAAKFHEATKEGVQSNNARPAVTN